MSRIRIDFAAEHVEVEVPDGALIRARRGTEAPPLSDVPAAVRQALAAPLEFPELRRALTPDDHVAIIIAENLSHLPELLGAVVEEVLSAGVELPRITVLCPPRIGEAIPWSAALPETLRNVPVEVHQPGDRSKLSYLATTKAGRRIYLNRTLVDADQLVVIGRLGYDPVLGYEGGLGDIFPALSDEATRSEFALKVSSAIPGQRTWPAEQEADEVGWLLGMPFVLQVIEGYGDDLVHVLAGTSAAVAKAGRPLLEQQWHVTAKRLASLVIATIQGEPRRHSFHDVARAFASATRAVRPSGRIVVLSRVRGPLGPSMELARQAESAANALGLAREQKLADSAALWELATASQHAQLYLLSDLARETAEELFVIPLDQAGQVQQLVNQAESIVVLPDAHRTMAVVTE